jgi:hypothetical protein
MKKIKPPKGYTMITEVDELPNHDKRNCPIAIIILAVIGALAMGYLVTKIPKKIDTYIQDKIEENRICSFAGKYARSTYDIPEFCR